MRPSHNGHGPATQAVELPTPAEITEQAREGTGTGTLEHVGALFLFADAARSRAEILAELRPTLLRRF